MASERDRRRIRASFDSTGARGPDRLGNFYLNCPFCIDLVDKEDVKFKLSCNPRAEADDGTLGGWNCFRCGVAGWGGLDFLGEPDSRPRGPVEAPRLGPPDGFYPFRGNEQSRLLEPYRQYVKRRGVYEAVEAIGGGAAVQGRYAGRVVVPYVVDRAWQGWSARLVRRGEPKYLYPPGMERRTALWGRCWVPPDDRPVWLVEGVFDALPLFPYGVCTFGKNVTDDQVELLRAWGRRVVVCLDGDAWLEGKVLAARLRFRGVQADWCHLPPKTDPGGLGWRVRKFVQPGQ